MTKAWCDAEPISDWAPVCPSLTGLSPTSGLIAGGFNVSIRGGPFVNSTNLKVRFSKNELNATVSLLNTTFIDDSTLLIVMPQVDNTSAGEYKLALEINGILYIQQELSFTYFAPAAAIVIVNGDSGVPPGGIAGIVVGMAVIIAALIIALIIMKRRKVGFFAEFKLKEPDYPAVAYGQTMQPQWRVAKDNWEILAIKMLAKDNGFVFSVMNTTAPTEQYVLPSTFARFFSVAKFEFWLLGMLLRVV